MELGSSLFRLVAKPLCLHSVKVIDVVKITGGSCYIGLLIVRMACSLLLNLGKR
uniref:Uncharacterized protein n=1 Tax=Arundo donax TaxID=35708 RepID=A0A0A9A2Q1_ARUDO